MVIAEIHTSGTFIDYSGWSLSLKSHALMLLIWVCGSRSCPVWPCTDIVSSADDGQGRRWEMESGWSIHHRQDRLCWNIIILPIGTQVYTLQYVSDWEQLMPIPAHCVADKKIGCPFPSKLKKCPYHRGSGDSLLYLYPQCALLLE